MHVLIAQGVDNEFINKLIDMGASLDIKAKDGSTLLDYAIKKKNTEIAKTLLENGVSCTEEGVGGLRELLDQKTILDAINLQEENLQVKVNKIFDELNRGVTKEKIMELYKLGFNANTINAKYLAECAKYNKSLSKFVYSESNYSDNYQINELQDILTLGKKAIAKLTLISDYCHNAYFLKKAVYPVESNYTPTQNDIESEAHKVNIDSVLEEVKSIIDNIKKSGLDVRFVDIEDKNLLSYLLSQPNSNITTDEKLAFIEYLVKEEKFNLDIRGVNGRTALHYAAIANNDVEVILKLQELGANVNAKDDDGKTPIMHAAERGNDNAIIGLYNLGANINIVSKSDKNLDDYARETNNALIIRLVDDIRSHYNEICSNNILEDLNDDGFYFAKSLLNKLGGLDSIDNEFGQNELVGVNDCCNPMEITNLSAIACN